MAKLIHFFGTFHTLGGVESILEHHHRLDAKYGINSAIVSAFNKNGRGKSDPLTLGLTGLSTIRDLRRKFSMLIAEHKPETMVYHNLWGCHSLCDLDQARRRIGLIHTDSTFMRQVTAREAGALDGVIAVSTPIADFVKSVWPLPERIRQIAYPVARPPELKNQYPSWHEPFRLGYCGRLCIEQKRVDRLPQARQKLRATFPRARIEILGEGDERQKLEKLWRTEKDIIFHGREAGNDYWHTLSNWDAIIFTSDFEGTPISLLEAMSVGVLPIYPVMGSGGDDYVRKLSPKLLYQHDDAKSLTAVFEWLKSLTNEEVSSLRKRAGELVAAHSLENYFKQFTAHLNDFAELPVIGRSHKAKFPFLIERTPFFLWNKSPRMREIFAFKP